MKVVQMGNLFLIFQVIGPAGCGKSTYCSTMLSQAISSGRSMNLINLDPAAEEFLFCLIMLLDLLMNL